MKFHKNSFIIIAILLFGTLYAQQEPNYTLYRYTMNAINPAYAGADGNTNLVTNFKNQWITVDGAPETQTFFYAQPVSNKVGLGLSVINDQIFIENRTSFNIDFSYRLQISESLNLFFGLKAGGSTYDIDRNDLVNIGLEADPALNNIDTGFSPNVGAGVYLFNDNYFVSLSSPNLISNERINYAQGRATQATEEPHVYLSGGYNLILNDKIEFRPSTMIRYVSGSPLSADITTAFRFYNRFEAGVAYRTDEALSGLLMINVIDWLDLGYAYDSSTRSEISDISNGTHEIFLKLSFKSKKASKSDENSQ